MASNPINSWQMEGEKVEVVTGLLFLGFKITGDSDSSLEIRWLLLGRKTRTNLDSVLKNRDITLSTKSLYSLGYGLPSGHVQLWDLDNKEGRTPKNWCLQTMMLEKTPESSLDSREIKPVNLKWNQPWIFTGKLMVKLKLQYFGHLMCTDDSLEMSLILEKTEGRRRRGCHRKRWLDSITDTMTVNFGKLWEMGRDREA